MRTPPRRKRWHQQTETRGCLARPMEGRREENRQGQVDKVKGVRTPCCPLATCTYAEGKGAVAQCSVTSIRKVTVTPSIRSKTRRLGAACSGPTMLGSLQSLASAPDGTTFRTDDTDLWTGTLDVCRLLRALLTKGPVPNEKKIRQSCSLWPRWGRWTFLLTLPRDLPTAQRDQPLCTRWR